MRDSDDNSDWELPDHGDDEEDESLTVACPACGADVYEDAEQCPVCGEYVTHSTRAWDGKPLWWIILGVAGIIAVILAFAPRR
jgi:RNA polymerase subunit RPABC4/transcription elongation factor Spt4